MMNPIRALALILATGLLLSPALGQEPAKPPSEGPAEARPPKVDYQILPLKNAAASEAAKLLSELFSANPRGGPGSPGKAVRVVADPNTNSLLIQATAADLDAIRAILNKVDMARSDDTGRLSVFQLNSVEPDKALEDALKLLTAGRGFSLDRQRKMLIVYSDKRTTEEVESLLSRMEDQAKRPPTPDVQIRVVWLMNIPAQGKDDAKDEGQPLPPDLKALLPDLAKLGIDRPRLNAQILVNVTPGAEFEAAGTALSGDPFPVSGRYTDRKGAPSLHLNVRATRKNPNGSASNFAQIQTDITAPVGHLVVLGMTPTDTTTSVFIVQVLRPATLGR